MQILGKECWGEGGGTGGYMEIVNAIVLSQCPIEAARQYARDVRRTRRRRRESDRECKHKNP